MRRRTLLVSAVVFAAALSAPATFVGAQEPAPADPAPAANQPPPPAPPPVPEQPPADQAPPPAQTYVPPPAATSSASATASGSGSVSIVGATPGAYAFSPASVTVQTGDTISWTNSSSAPEGHDVSGSGFDSGVLQQGQSYSHTFATAGTFSYICSIHPSMKGTVTVEAASTGGGGGSSGGGGSTSTLSAPGATAPGSESAAGASPGAAGSSTQLPSTGLSNVPILALGAGLLVAGLLLRRRIGARSRAR